MTESNDSLVLSLLKVQVDSSRDTMAFFQRVHKLNRLEIEHIQVPQALQFAGLVILAVIALRILWVFLHPVLGPYLGLAPTPAKKPSEYHVQSQTGGGFSNPKHRAAPASKLRTPEMGRSGLKVSKRPKPIKGSGGSLPRW